MKESAGARIVEPKYLSIFALYIIMYKGNKYGKPEKQPIADRAEG